MTGETIAVLEADRNHAEFIVRAIARTGRRVVWTKQAREALDSGATLVVASQAAVGGADAMLQFIAGALMRGQHTIAVTSDRPSAAGGDAVSLGAVAVVSGWWKAEAISRAVDEYYARTHELASKAD